VEWEVHVARMDEMRSEYKTQAGKLEDKKLLMRPTRKREDKIKM